jgi:hypothetical protein
MTTTFDQKALPWLWGCRFDAKTDGYLPFEACVLDLSYRVALTREVGTVSTITNHNLSLRLYKDNALQRKIRLVFCLAFRLNLAQRTVILLSKSLLQNDVKEILISVQNISFFVFFLNLSVKTSI